MNKFMLVFAFSLALGQLEGQELHPLGLIWKDPRTTCPGNRTTVALKAPRSLPAKVDHSANMPPVGDQGSQGSCTAWAVGYYYKTYQEWREHGWSTADSSRQCSPSFIYNQINGGYDWGSWFGDAFQLLCEQGCAPFNLAPYNSADCSSWPCEAAYDSALPYRCLAWHWFDVYDDTGIQAVKQLLDQGDNVVIGLSVYANYDDINSYDTTYCVADLSGENRGGHANCIVGYDDNKATNDGLGAFRVVNSWGPGWGQGGYYWFSYQALKDGRTSYQSAFYADDRIGYQPSLKLKARLAHPRRSTVEITAGIGPGSAPVWAKGFYTSYGGGPRPFPANNMVFDISEGASQLSTVAGNNIFIRCRDIQTDGQAGSIDSLSVIQTAWELEAVSTETPVAIGDDVTNYYANLSFHCKNFAVTAAPAMKTVVPGNQAMFMISLSSINGFAHPVELQYQLSPLPASGTLTVDFTHSSIVPTDSSLMTVSASADAAPGHYRVNVTAIDPIHTIVHQAAVGVVVLGLGQALCVGADAPMLALTRNIWPAADSVWSVPPVIGGNYQAVIIQSGASPCDTPLLRNYLAGGGTLLLTCHAPRDLCAGNSLAPISSWLGADTYNYYWGNGMSMVCDLDHPFSISTIHAGDVLGIAQYGYGRLLNIHSGAVPVAHLGTAVNSLAALANDYGTGRCFWYSGKAGLGTKSDSLLAGFLHDAGSGVVEQNIPAAPAAGRDFNFEIFPNPTAAAIRLSLILPAAGPVTVRFYDLTGRLIRTLHNGALSSGSHALDWKMTGTLAAGCYFIRVETSNGARTRKIIIVK